MSLNNSKTKESQCSEIIRKKTLDLFFPFLFKQTNVLKRGGWRERGKKGGEGERERERKKERERKDEERKRDCRRSMDGSLLLAFIFTAPASNILFQVLGCLQIQNCKEYSVLHLILVQPYSGNTGGTADQLISLN